jgi:hypothetical protein
MMESFFEKLLDKSALMAAVRRSMKKATILGIADAVGGNSDQSELEMGELSGPTTERQGEGEQASKVVQGMPLPRPQLIGIAAKKPDDEPDRPGVPPKSVRKKRGDRNEVGESNATPRPSPELNGEKGAGT